MSGVSDRLGIVVVGYGYWGPNIARNIVECPDFHLMGLCEQDKWRAAEFRERHPGVRVYGELEPALLDERVHAVAIATPPHTHFPLALRALEAGKHVLVEKPLATSSTDAAVLIALAEERGLVLMPGHTFVYSPSVTKVRELIQEDVLGEIYFITSSRMNLGKYQRDGVVRDLAPHDLSILSYWLGEPPTQVSAHGRSVFQEDVPETAFMTLDFAGGTKASVQISWLAPRKVRHMVVVGSKRMVQYEDSSADESIRIYDRGLEFEEPPSNFGEYRLTYRSGDMVAPRIDAAEPLGLEFQDFARAIREGAEPRSSAAFGLEVVLALEALQESLELGGSPVTVRSGASSPHGRHRLAAAHAEAAGAGGNRNGHAGNGADAGNGNGHGANAGNGVGHVMIAVRERRLDERRLGERRHDERRRAAAVPPGGVERRLADRRSGDRRAQDRRLAEVPARDVA